MKHILSILVLLVCAVAHAAPVITGIPVSQLPTTNRSPDTAWVIVDQHGVGKSTNDTFKISVVDLLSSRTIPATNIFNTVITTNLYATNITVNNITVTTNVTINGTNVGVINPTDGYIPYRMTTNSFGDSPLYRVDSNTVAVYQLDADIISATNLQAGGVVVSEVLTGILTNMPAGTGYLYNDGTNLFSWSGVPTGYWTNISGVLQPIDLTPPVMITNQLIWVGFLSNSTNYSRGAISHTGTNGAWVFNSQGAGTAGTGRPFNFNIDGTNFFTLELSGAPTHPSLIVSNASGATYVSANGNVGEVKHNSALDLIANSGASKVRWWSTGFVPLQAASELGHNGGGQYPWGNFKMQGTAYVYGFNPDVSDASNYSRGAISHTGTNGAWVFDSQSAGSAGNPRPIVLTNAPAVYNNLAKWYSDADHNLGLGESALGAISGGGHNVMVGRDAGLSLTTADNNVAVGSRALSDSTGVVDSVAVGGQALRHAGNLAARLTAVGESAGSNATGTDSVYIGRRAGQNITNSFNTIVGANIGELVSPDATATNVVAIGYGVTPRASSVAQIGTNGVSVLYLNGTVGWFRGTGSPESSVSAPVGSYYSREDGGAGTTFYVKESGTGNTGWVAK